MAKVSKVPRSSPKPVPMEQSVEIVPPTRAAKPVPTHFPTDAAIRRMHDEMMPSEYPQGPPPSKR